MGKSNMVQSHEVRNLSDGEYWIDPSFIINLAAL